MVQEDSGTFSDKGCKGKGCFLQCGSQGKKTGKTDGRDFAIIYIFRLVSSFWLLFLNLLY